MDLSSLTAISPVDGRYRSKVSELDEFFSEYALIRYRLMVEVEYFIALCELPLPQLATVDPKHFDQLRALYEEFELEDALEIKTIEQETNHDVKAIEYYLKHRFDAMKLGGIKEFVHFGLTSQDINNTSIPMSIRDAHQLVLMPALNELLDQLVEKTMLWKDVPMLARTHGQPASPTKLGKELYVFAERLMNQLGMIKNIPFTGKFGGATGNLNAHAVAYPQIDWDAFATSFLAEKLNIQRQRTTTQIEHYDYLAAYFDNLKRINTILTDFCRDMWQYIAMDYFKQIIKAGEVGSSAMPHKVNPIDFENAEGNLGLANAMFEHLSAKLPISRLQRDLTDSTVTRNIGVPLAHTLIALKSIQKGMDKLMLNAPKIIDDLDQNMAVVAEAIQTILRREQYEGAFEALKGLTRTNEKIDTQTIHYFINTLDLPDAVKAELMRITPHNYTGLDLLKHLEA
jgi:adenylosuccinate lyase